MSSFYTGTYVVKNKEKYIGNKNPTYRSSWECRLMRYMDDNINVIKWGYECISIQYINRIDTKIHRYFPDFYAEIINNQGELNKFIIEIKPLTQTSPPKQPKNNNQKAQKRYLNEASTYIINMCKWEACNDFCNKHGLIFKLVTEKELF